MLSQTLGKRLAADGKITSSRTLFDPFCPDQVVQHSGLCNTSAHQSAQEQFMEPTQYLTLPYFFVFLKNKNQQTM